MLDYEVIEKFKEFQQKTGKYNDLDIEVVRFEKVSLSDDKYFRFVKGKNKYIQKYITKNPGKYPILGSSLKNGCVSNYIHYIDKDDVIDELCVTYNKDNAKGSVPFFRDIPFLMDRHHIAIIPSNLIDAKYLEKSLIYYFKKMNFGWGDNVATVDALQTHFVPLPKDLENYTSLDIQKIIVEFLEFGFKWLDGIKQNIDKQYNLYTRLRKSLIPSTFKKDFIKVRFAQYAKEHSIDFNITDVDFEETVLNKIADFPSMTRVVGGYDITLEEYQDLLEDKKNYFALVSGTVENNQVSGYVHKRRLTAKSLSKPNSISWTRINGQVFFLQESPVCTNDDSFVMEVHNNHSTEYVRYATMQTMRLKTFHWGNKAGKNKVKAIELLVPKPLNKYTSYDIQKIIADFINEVDDELQKKFDWLEEGYDVVKRFKKAYLARTFSLIDWSK